MRVLLLSALGAITGVSTAFAVNFGSYGVPFIGGGVWVQGDAYFTVGRLFLTPAVDAGTVSAVANLQQVPLFLPSSAPTNYCHDSVHDACVLDENYGDTGWFGQNVGWGWTWGSHPFQGISMSVQRINLFYVPFPIPAQTAACHELGHAVGLRHRNGSCMQAASPPSLFYSSHDLAHLEDWFD